MNQGRGGGAVDRVVSMKLDASVDSKKELRREVFIPISYALSELTHAHTLASAYSVSQTHTHICTLKHQHPRVHYH